VPAIIPAVRSDDPTPEDLAFLRELAIGYQYTQVLAVAARFRIIDVIADGAISLADIAREIGSDEQTMAIVLAILGHLGIVRCGSAGYRVTARGVLLRADHPAGVWPLLAASGNERYHAWSALGETLATGRPSFPALFGGVSLHDYYAAQPDASAVFNRTMAALSTQTIADLVDIHPWARHRVIADVGGGLGVTLSAILHAAPGLSGVLVDLPHVAIAAQDTMLRAHLAERCRIVGADARIDVPPADLYLFRMVLCDFPDQDAVAMLRACYSSADADAQLVIIDRLRTPNSDSASLPTLMSTLNLMVMTGSVERTEQDYALLLHAAGWILADVQQTRALGGDLHYLCAIPR
jgi:hypothetical protein